MRLLLISPYRLWIPSSSRLPFLLSYKLEMVTNLYVNVKFLVVATNNCLTEIENGWLCSAGLGRAAGSSCWLVRRSQAVSWQEDNVSRREEEGYVLNMIQIYIIILYTLIRYIRSYIGIFSSFFDLLVTL